jgi:hypothetical protein
MNYAKSEAIATADAHLSNVGLPTYSELLALAQSAAALAAWHVPAREVADLSEVARIRRALEPLAITTGLEA